MSFDSQIYLDRIGLKACEPTLSGLRALQVHQMRAIAFENVEPFNGHVPDIGEDAVWKKLVEHRKGGYCLELNALFGMALQSFGFSARPVLGRVRNGAPQGGPRAHLAFVVTIDDVDWIADTGFGGPGPCEPLRLDTSETQLVRGHAFRIVFDEKTGEHVIERAAENGWFPVYGFDDVAPSSTELEAANYLCATWDKSPFSSNLIFYRLTEADRISLFNTTARLGDSAVTTELSGLSAFRDLVREEFGLAYDDGQVKTLWERLSRRLAEAAA